MQWQASYEQQTVEEIFKIKNENLTMQDIIEKISTIAIRLARQLDANNTSIKENVRKPSHENYPQSRNHKIEVIPV